MIIEKKIYLHFFHTLLSRCLCEIPRNKSNAYYIRPVPNKRGYAKRKSNNPFQFFSNNYSLERPDIFLSIHHILYIQIDKDCVMSQRSFFVEVLFPHWIFLFYTPCNKTIKCFQQISKKNRNYYFYYPIRYCCIIRTFQFFIMSLCIESNTIHEITTLFI